MSKVCDPWYGAMKLKPETAAEVNEVATVQGMRKRLNEYAYRGGNPMVKAIMDSARYRGLSGEDMMTWLAYEALIGYEHLQGLILEDAMRSPHPPLIMVKDKP